MNFFEDYITDPLYLDAYGFDEKWFLYVEDESDIPFWEDIINKFFPNKYNIMPAVQQNSNERGKNALEKFFDKANQKFIIALDSDFDFICPNGRTPNSTEVNSQKYILQTYLYSRESFIYNPKKISTIIKKVRYTYKSNFDIENLINIYSKNIYEAFIPFLYLTENKKSILINGINLNKDDFFNKITIKNKSKITDSNFEINTGLLEEHLSEMILLKVELEKLILNIEDYKNFKSNISDKGLNELNSCLFISGHSYEQFINNAFEHIISILILKEIEILKIDTSGTDLDDKIKKMKKHFRDYCCYKTMIYQSSIDESDEFILKIFDDIKKMG